MKLLYVTDNGFCKREDNYYYSAPNVAHINNLSPYFDSFIIIARDDVYANGYKEAQNNMSIHLVKKIDILTLKKMIYRYIDECDAVICYGTNGYFASVIGRKKGKVVISYNGGDPYDFCISRGNIKGKILAPLARYMCKKSFENSDFGHYCDDFLFERYPAKGKMLACSGVDIECDENVLQERLRRINAFSDIKIKLGLTGHTKNSLKGIDIAIKAIGKLGSQYSLEVAGRGDTTAYMRLAEENGCGDRVKFLGALAPGDELMHWLDSLDIYVQPSRIEGLPRATIEAMSRACPVVSSNAGALLKLIDDNFVFDVNKPDDFAGLIKKISNRDSMREQAIKNFEKSKNYERTVRDKKYADFYHEVICEIEHRRCVHPTPAK